MMAALKVDNLSLKLEGKEILSSVSFSVEKGSLAVICGRNGAGKSQLLRTLKGLERPSGGTIEVWGEDLTKDRSRRLREIALVFQNADLQIVADSVERDIMFSLENLRMPKDEIKGRTEHAITLLGLGKQRKQRPATLSGGEKRKVAIAGVLVADPKILLLDEPFANLDYPSTVTVLKSILKLKESGVTTLIVTHEAEKFLAHADKVIVLKEGSVLFEGKPEDSLEMLRSAEVYVPRIPLKEMTWLT